MTSAYIGSMETWIKQNQAETVDFAEGCLLDNAIYQCKRGTAFVFEDYATANSSKYLMRFFRTDKNGRLKNPEEQTIFDKFSAAFEAIKQTTEKD